MDESEVLRAPHVLEFPYKRSLGPVIGAFMTGLRDGHILGARTKGGRVVVPPTEYDPETGDDVETNLVPVGPGGTVRTWSWAANPRPDQPLDRPFAWVLVDLDGADTAMLHVLDAGTPERCSVRNAGVREVPRCARTESAACMTSSASYRRLRRERRLTRRGHDAGDPDPRSSSRSPRVRRSRGS